ncbi:MAG: endonuclease III [Nitrospinaceae bacterium]|nr:endonuclease III [Nitrospinaceae bacterium]NIR55421.1 endonuclease III [Nitrospinaceae bacterium]NIS85861.1 endonuclease III [Nitrospinaceae bacterium]NIT82705.1 endonuclease III [Nitrospinaceae bacterium]NIU44914.1 endonuclease III [Nitrospinaceae bacterium]
MNNRLLGRVLRRVEAYRDGRPAPAMVKISRRTEPFQILVGCLISSRTRDEVTGAVCNRLFGGIQGPRDMLRMTLRQLEKALYPAAFYRNKAKTLKRLCRDLMNRFEGRVPDTLEELLTLEGVGRKTANLTLILAFDRPGICVDTHVHRIVNRWGYVETANPDQTEQALRQKLPAHYWKKINDLLVVLGQNCCRPVSPFCTECVIREECPRIGVRKHR